MDKVLSFVNKGAYATVIGSLISTADKGLCQLTEMDWLGEVLNLVCILLADSQINHSSPENS